MSLSILYNTTAIAAQNQLNVTSMNLQKTLLHLSSGSRINSGADDAAGLAIANGLNANIAALTQSSQNANNGVGVLQVADGALSQVTNLLTRAVTLATEASNGTVSTTQQGDINAEFTAIKAEIDRIGTATTFNGQQVFQATGTSSLDVFLSDATTSGTSTISIALGALGQNSLNFGASTVDLTNDKLDNKADATAALADINQAIENIASTRGGIGAGINRLQSASQVITTQTQNLTSAESGIVSADISQEVANMTNQNILMQTGMSALQQANQSQQAILKLLQ